MSEVRTVVYDEQLKIEAYQFQGIMQKFPNHFHEHYVIGFIEKGKRHLSCMNHDYEINPGDLMLFHPKMNHTCEQMDNQTLDYRCLNIPIEVMKQTVQEIEESRINAATINMTYMSQLMSYDTLELPVFSEPVIFHAEQIPLLRELHEKIMEGSREFEKEELYYFLMAQLLHCYASKKSEKGIEADEGVYAVCNYIEAHFQESITLDELSKVSHRNKYVLLRNFTKIKGITPYQYLLTVRINHAKKMLESDMEESGIADIALETGFTDQSHFTNAFKKIIGVTPGQYRLIRSGLEYER